MTHGAAIRGDHHSLNKAWSEFLKARVSKLVDELEPIVTDHLHEAHRFLAAVGLADTEWDPTSFQRRAVEPSELDSIPHDLDVLVDAAADIVEFLCENNQERADAVITSWASSAAPLLRRLAIHGIAKSRFHTADHKLQWLLSRG